MSDLPSADQLPSSRRAGSDRLIKVGLWAFVAASAAGVYLLRNTLDGRIRATIGIVCFLAVIAACSTNLRAVNWRTVGLGIALQFTLALVILRVQIGGVRPGYLIFEAVARVVMQFLEFTTAGSVMVFGGLADPEVMSQLFPGGFIFAFTALPTIIFVSSFFTVLYHFGVLQFVVRLMARAMMYLLQTSGAETLAAAANVFMGQTEAPLIVKPYVQRMTQSELLALMVGGFATIAGGVMVVYIQLGADPVAILTTSVMAAPCGLYLSKLLLPETEESTTRGSETIAVERQHVNAIDAAAAGATDGTVLAINVAAMLIAFLAFIALVDYLLGMITPTLTLARVFSWVFAPVAALIGVAGRDVPAVADLLGTKLVTNEFVSYIKLTSQYQDVMDDRSRVLATYALTGFANLGSLGIQLGGIGGIAPMRRHDLARLGSRALLAGFVATLINASIAAILL